MAVSKRKCRHCKEYQLFEKMIKVPLGYFCTYDHARQYGIKKAQEAKERKKRKDQKEAKESLKTKTDYVQEAEKAVRDYVRTRDHGKPCISCGRNPREIRGGAMDAGHYRSKGAAKQVRFNTYNINAQCVYCNRDLSGNVVEYRKGMIKKYGVEITERIEYDNSIKRYTVDYLKRLKSVFQKRRRHLIKIRGKNV